VQVTTPRRVRNMRYRKRARDLAIEPITAGQMCAGFAHEMVTNNFSNIYLSRSHNCIKEAQLHQRI
jgi:hypothetical protein